ncbi:MAG TPA: efflux RND transporter permease subunit [Devosia sp.]|nr:efflux RND transporter permease subunit [Devosia sp.]
MSIEAQNQQGARIAGLFVRRPVLAVVINALIVVGGLAAFLGVEVRELPQVDQPVLSINTSWDGASADAVDREITSTIEGAVARVQGVTGISSTSSYGRSRVTLTFADGTNLDNATSDVRDATARLTNRFPDGVDAPTIVKADSDAQAIMQLSVTSPTMSRDDLTNLVDNQISKALAAVPGVADLQIYGEQAKVFTIDVDPNKLAAVGLTVGNIETALGSIAFDTAAGTLNGANQNISVRATADVKTPQDFENIIINGKTRLGDVATVLFGPANSSSGLHSDGKSGIGIGIIRAAQSNTVQISEGVYKAVAQLQATLPKDVSIKVSSDDSIFISGALHEVERSLGLAVVIVIAVIFVFLMDWRATLVPAISMPVALIGSIAGIYLAGFSINILTLLAIVLATGLVVDDSIVVLENIVRRRGLGAGPRAAAVLGTQEVFFAVIATSLTLIAVFVPISFLPGQTGRLFREFGFTLAICVALSCAVALSLGPMLASRFLKEHDHDLHRHPIAGTVGRIGRFFAGLYRRILHFCLDTPLVVIVIAVLFAGSAVFVFGSIRQELTPPEDRAAISIRVSAPPTVSLDFTQTQMQKIEDLVQPLVKSGEVKSIFSVSGFGSNTSSGFITLTLAPWEQRVRSQQQIAAQVNQLLQFVPGVRTFLAQSNSLGIRGGGNGLQFAVAGNDYGELAATAQKIADEMSKDPRFGRVTVNYSATTPELTLSIDRDKAAALGIDINGLGTTMQSMIDGASVGQVFVGDEAYPVRMLSTTSPVNDPGDLENIFLKTQDGKYVPMSSIATLKEAPIAPQLTREQQRRDVSVSASLDGGYALGDAYQRVLQIAAPMLPKGDTILPLAEAKTIGDSNYGLAITFGFAVLVILLVLSAQFESVYSAVIVMVTVPFGLACAVYAVLVTGGSLNVYSQIGLIMVVGIMAKNGILIVEFANQLRDRGLSVREAIEESANIRLRPVLMTMIATVLGGVPLVISTGAGAEARQALGWIIVGGLGFAAVSTLFLTPVAYLLLARFSKPKAHEAERLENELTRANTALIAAPAE